MNSVLQDLRFATRVFRRNPGVTLAAVFTLAIAIGVNATVFSYVDSAMLRPLPLDEQGRLIRVFTGDDKYAYGHSSYPDYLDYQENCRSCVGLAAIGHYGFLLGGDGPLISTQSHTVSENYFTLLGVKAQIGRLFTAGDESVDEPVVVISHNLWQRRYGGDPRILDKPILINGTPHDVIGVTPEGFRGADLRRDPDLWIPLSNWRFTLRENLQNRSRREYVIVGRLRSDASVEQARAEIAGAATRLAKAYPATNAHHQAVVSSEARYRLRTGKPGLIMLAVVGLVLLIACLNVASLLLGQAERRRREIAIRMAVGSTRARLVRQLVTEGVLLAVFGTFAGLLLASWLIQLMPVVVVPPSSWRSGVEFGLDNRVLTYGVASALATIGLFALVPALRASRPDLSAALAGSQSLARHSSVTPQRRMLVTQVATSIALLIGTGILAKTFIQGLYTDVGFQRKNLLVAEILFRGQSQQVSSFYDELINRMESILGLRGTALALRAPLSRSGGGLSSEVSIPGYAPPSESETPKVKYTVVSPEYFRTVGVPRMRGRLFGEQDMRAKSRAVVINESMARRFWPDADPLGKIVRIGKVPGTSHEVIGIVGDTTINNIREEAEPYFYLPFGTGRYAYRTLIAETAGDPLDLAELVRTEIAALDKDALVTDITTMDRLVHLGLHNEKLSTAAVGALALMGLILAASGLYGVVSYSVTRRTREIGLRMAMGATNNDALSLILWQGLRIALTGALFGIAGGVAVSRVLGSEVIDIDPWDPLIFLGAAALMIGVALLASYIPARRAARVDPVVALRCE